ncbi:MAG TPA: DoxX family protein [Variovorax sp.]|nr:DoxX family protein [Variovorax sp.]
MLASSTSPAVPAGIGATLQRRGLVLAQRAMRGLEALSPVLDLAIRVFIAIIFFKAGLTKIASWETTVALFENEYMVPLLPPALAAFMATAAELALPVMLVLGLGTRFAALGLFVLNIVAVISYPDIGEVGLKDHQMWGLFLLVSLLHGPGFLSLDHFIRRRFFGLPAGERR